MRTQSKPVWECLLDAGLVEGGMPANDNLDSPWFVKVILAISGWFAAAFILGFLGLGFEDIFESPTASLILGGLMIIGAYALLRNIENVFIEHAAMAVSFAGQVLVIFFFIKINDDAMAWLGVAILQLALALIMPNFVHGVLSSLFFAVCFSIALNLFGIPYIASVFVMGAAAWIWLHEFDMPHYIKKDNSDDMGRRFYDFSMKKHAIGYGLVLALIPIKCSFLFLRNEKLYDLKIVSWLEPWVGELLIAVIFFLVVWELLKRLSNSASKFDGIASNTMSASSVGINTNRLTAPINIILLIGSGVLAMISMEAQGITIGMTILILGFAGSNRVLLGVGVLSILLFTSSYYYLLETTLLQKSLTLCIVGMIMLVVRWFLLRNATREQT